MRWRRPPGQDEEEAHGDRRAQAAARRRRDHARGLHGPPRRVPRRAPEGEEARRDRPVADDGGPAHARRHRGPQAAHPVAHRAAVAHARSATCEFWSTGASIGSGQRIEFEGSELVWQYYPGQGLQIQVLGNFGKLNGLWGGKSNARLAVMLDELLPLAVERAGGARVGVLLQLRRRQPAVGLAGSRRAPPSRRSRAAPRGCTARPTCCRSPSAALAIFRKRTPTGVRVPAAHGDHYAIYSFAPEPARAQRLHPVAGRALRLRADRQGPAGHRAVSEGRAARRARRRRSTTPAPGRCTRAAARRTSRRSPTTTCSRASSPACARARRSTSTARRPTTSSPTRAWRRCYRALQDAARRRYGRVRFELSKISNVTLQDHAQRQGRGVAPVRRRRIREAHVRLAGSAQARDLRRDARGDRPGRQSRADASTTVRVLKPKKKKRP